MLSHTVQEAQIQVFPQTCRKHPNKITGTADEMEAQFQIQQPDLWSQRCIEPIAPLNIKFPGDFSQTYPDIIEDLNKQLKARILELGGSASGLMINLK